MDVPDVSVLIASWNTRDLVLACLDALPAGIGSERSYEVIVVDNASTDGSLAALKRRTDIILIQNAENRGFAAAINQAYSRSGAAHVLVLNSDVELLPGSVDALVRVLEQPNVAGAAPLYRNPDGSPQPFHFRIPTFMTILANASSAVRQLPGMRERLRAYRMLDDDFSHPRAVQQPSASCLLLRRSTLPVDHIFDERYPIFFNDVQFARSVARSGHELWVTPDAVVVHEAHASTRQLGGALKRQYVASVVRMLEETEPRRNVLVYRAVVFAQNLVFLALRRPSALSWRELRAALAGDAGPLPSTPGATGE